MRPHQRHRSILRRLRARRGELIKQRTDAEVVVSALAQALVDLSDALTVLRDVNYDPARRHTLLGALAEMKRKLELAERLEISRPYDPRFTNHAVNREEP